MNVLFVLPTTNNLDYGTCVMKNVVLPKICSRFNCIVLEGDNATPSNFFNALSQYNPTYVFILGHGNPDQVYVQGMNLLLSVDTPAIPAVANGRFIHINGCQTAEELGPALINNGAVGYLGEDQDFLFLVNEPPCSSLDVEAPYIAEYTFEEAVFSGLTFEEAFKQRNQAFENFINQYTYSNSDIAPLLATILQADEDMASLLGKTTLTIFTLGYPPPVALASLPTPSPPSPTAITATQAPAPKNTITIIIAGVLTALAVGGLAYYLKKKRRI